MARPIRFEDAVRLLTGGDDAVLTTVDRVLDVVLATTNVAFQVDLFAPRNAVMDIAERRSGPSG